MKILYIHQYFKTPNEPGGTRSYWISRELVKKGHEVYMVTSCNNSKSKIKHKVIDGINVIFIRNSYDMSFTFFQRLKSFVRFMYLSYKEASKIKNVDCVFATSTPLTVGITALMLKYIRKFPFIFEVRDLWPEVPIQMGAIRNPLLKWICNTLEKIIYKQSEHIVALAPGMYEGVLSKGILEEKVSMIPNMAKIDEFFLRDIKDETYKKYNLKKSSFKVIHFGAIGLANGVEYIIEAAKILDSHNENSIDFIFAGGGSQENKMVDLVNKYKLTNVYFLGKLKMIDISELVNACDCSIVSFANIPILKTNSPNKLFDSLSAQKPVVVNSAGWTKMMVEENKCGAYVDPTAPSELADLLINWQSNEELIYKMGRNARYLAENKYDKSILAKEVVSVIENKIKE